MLISRKTRKKATRMVKQAKAAATKRGTMMMKQAKAYAMKRGTVLARKASAYAKERGTMLAESASAYAKKRGKVLAKKARVAARAGGKVVGKAAGRTQLRLVRAAKDLGGEMRRVSRRRKVKQAIKTARDAVRTASEVALAIGTVAAMRMRARGRAAQRRRAAAR